MATGRDPAVPRRAVPAFAPRRAAPDEAAGERREEPRAAGALARDLPAARRPQHLHRRLSGRDRGRVRAPARLHARGADRSRRLLRLFAGRRRDAPTSCPACCRRAVREERRARFMARRRGRSSIAKLRERVGATMQVLVDSAPALGRKGGCRPQLCRCARDRRPGPPAAAREGVEDAQGRRVHARAHRRRRRPRPGRRCRSDARRCRHDQEGRRGAAPR